MAVIEAVSLAGRDNDRSSISRGTMPLAAVALTLDSDLDRLGSRIVASSWLYVPILCRLGSPQGPLDAWLPSRCSKPSRMQGPDVLTLRAKNFGVYAIRA
jgi:hypothetical protein